MATKDCFREECVERLIKLACGWIFWCGNVAMMSTAMFQGEMTVKHLGEAPQANTFVETLLLVDELVSGKSVDSSHLSPHVGKDTPVEEAMAMLVLKEEGKVGVFKRVQPCDYH